MVRPLSEADFWRDLKRKKRNKLVHWEVSPDRYSSGIPDRLVIVDGVTVLIELKCLNKFEDGLKIKTFQPQQALWMERWQHHGGKCGVLARLPGAKVALFTRNFFGLYQSGIHGVNNGIKVCHMNDVENLLIEEYCAKP